jgi:hypothetical protein
MKLFIKSVFAIILLCFTTNCFAQSANNISNPNFISELVFQNPVLISGTAGTDGAVYKFSNVANGIDATVKIVGRSSSSVILSNIDVSDMGWSKAFQPQLGIPGNVPANQEWWMEFEMRFYKAGTNNKNKIKGFQVTAIDVDGDGVSIREYLQMNRTTSSALSSVSYLTQTTPAACLSGFAGEDGDDNKGTDNKIQGPIQNFTNIDTAGTAVMATFTYEDKDMITFRYGGKSGAAISNAGERLNSLWFKAFSLAPMSTLPVTFHSFTATCNKSNVLLDWTADTDNTFSYYTVERSTDGKHFSEIGIVFTTGDQVSHYQFKDLNVSSATGTAFYRLRWKESKETSYSQVRVVRLRGEEDKLELSTYPNPVVNELRVSLPNEWQGKPVNLELYTTTGNRVQSLQISSSSQTETFRMNALPRGFYVVKASCEGESLQQRVIKD